MGAWDPWRGCHRYSTGCKYCYIHKGDYKKGIDTNIVMKTEKFYAPIEKTKSGAYKMKSGQLVFLCFTSDFLIEDADEWRTECWEMIRERSDLHFLFLTKRIERFMDCIPHDWKDGYGNITVEPGRPPAPHLPQGGAGPGGSHRPGSGRFPRRCRRSDRVHR